MKNPGDTPAGALIDLSAHFVKANGSTRPKVFTGAELEIAPGEIEGFRTTVSLKQHSTRPTTPARTGWRSR